MLQGKHPRFLFFTLAFVGMMSMSCFANALLFQAPSADPKEFAKYALQRNQQTYTQWVRENSMKDGVEAHSQVLEFSQQALSVGAGKQTLAGWEHLRQGLGLNRADREVLTLLAEKLHQQSELCRYLLLEPELAKILENPPGNCAALAVATPKAVLERLNPRDLLSIDGVIFHKDQIPPGIVKGSYQWKVLSDQYQDKIFLGSTMDFAKQKFSAENWIEGTCADYKLRHQDFSVLVQSQIYFNESCVKPGIPPEKTLSSWA